MSVRRVDECSTRDSCLVPPEKLSAEPHHAMTGTEGKKTGPHCRENEDSTHHVGDVYVLQGNDSVVLTAGE